MLKPLSNRLQNEGTVAYYLLFDNRFRASCGYLGAEFQETMENDLSYIDLNEVASPLAGKPYHGFVDYQGIDLQQQFPVQRKWALGLQSRAQPQDIMIEVLKELQALNVCWKNIGHYNMKCRWIHGFPGHNGGGFDKHVYNFFDDGSSIVENGVLRSPNVVKFEVQLYKTLEGKYLLDLQRVEGPQMLFLDLCTAFLAQLRVI